MEPLKAFIKEYGEIGNKKSIWGYLIELSDGSLYRKNFVEFVDNHYVIQEGTGPGFGKIIGVAHKPGEASSIAHVHIRDLAKNNLEGLIVDNSKYGRLTNVREN
jgi:hypothetical protein